MENNYYSPELAEFYEGFEYQKLVTNLDGSTEWITKEYSLIDKDSYYIANMFRDYNFLKLNEYLKNNFRVKYLDTEDIKSLGWIQIFVGTTDQVLYEKDGFELAFTDNIDFYGWNISIDNKNTNTSFKGIIKNKSDFKRLIKQLVKS